ncbi:hypothetical protein TWF730_002632 [Orbilia blumenaviensis]|uniref:Uncharacterized protein n=1 Tax=Orbilia blumenaviensis TaxID=1796055 RepID=A0AAV9UCP5_9PEZI
MASRYAHENSPRSNLAIMLALTLATLATTTNAIPLIGRSSPRALLFDANDLQVGSILPSYAYEEQISTLGQIKPSFIYRSYPSVMAVTSTFRQSSATTSLTAHIAPKLTSSPLLRRIVDYESQFKAISDKTPSYNPPELFPTLEKRLNQATMPISPRLSQEIHPDMICVPIGDPDSYFDPTLDGSSCRINSFCYPAPAETRYIGNFGGLATSGHPSPSSSAFYKAMPRYSSIRGGMPYFKGIQEYRNPLRNPRQEPTYTLSTVITSAPTVTIYLPAGTTDFPPHPIHPLLPAGAHPLSEYLEAAGDTIQPESQPQTTYSIIQLHPTSTSNNPQVSQSRTGPPKICRVPRVYLGVCHPVVIPLIVISAYILATYILYTGHAPPRSTNRTYPAAPRYFNPQSGMYTYPPVATVNNGYRSTLMTLVNCCFGDPTSSSGNMMMRSRDEERERANQSACYFLTTLMTYGAGLTVLGAFLGGLCNCVKSECEFA